MQSFPCPFCGARDEREFHYAGEAGKTRPDTTQPISDTDWADYLFAAGNTLGPAREIWVHIPCQEYFIMERNTLTMEVLAVTPMQEDEA